MGTLYVIATPIGNLGDITVRAARTLLRANIIVAESASKAGILLRSIEKQFPNEKKSEYKIISLSESEEVNKIPQIISFLEKSNVSLISEAGTPLISDPGFKLVRSAIKKNVKIVPIPGVSAPIAALSVAGFPTNSFQFIGFLPKSNIKKENLFKKYQNKKSTIIFFESPHRIVETLKVVSETLGNIEIAVCRELTKVHEEILRGKVSEVISIFEKKQPKGEITVLI